MSYVKSKKSFEVRGGIFFIILPCAKKHTTILILYRVLKKSTQQTHGFAVCQSKAHGKACVYL